MKIRLPECFVNGLIRFAQRTPYIHLAGYMNRWWLLPYNRFGYAARIHQFVSGDRDRHLHNHPWPYVTVILRGGYWEETPGEGNDWSHTVGGEKRKIAWHGPGSVLVRPADSFHRIDLELDAEGAEQSCWTLFMTGPKRADAPVGHSCWGFMVDGTYVPADVYLGPEYIDTSYTGASHGQAAG